MGSDGLFETITNEEACKSVWESQFKKLNLTIH